MICPHCKEETPAAHVWPPTHPFGLEVSEMLELSGPARQEAMEEYLCEPRLTSAHRALTDTEAALVEEFGQLPDKFRLMLGRCANAAIDDAVIEGEHWLRVGLYIGALLQRESMDPRRSAPCQSLYATSLAAMASRSAAEVERTAADAEAARAHGFCTDAEAELEIEELRGEMCRIQDVIDRHLAICPAKGAEA